MFIRSSSMGDNSCGREGADDRLDDGADAALPAETVIVWSVWQFSASEER